MSDLNQPPSRSPSGPLSVAELVAFFTSSVGEEKARDVVHAGVAHLHLSHKRSLDRAEALLVLEHLATDPGIIGVAARFAKARTLLRRF